MLWSDRLEKNLGLLIFLHAVHSSIVPPPVNRSLNEVQPVLDIVNRMFGEAHTLHRIWLFESLMWKQKRSIVEFISNEVRTQNKDLCFIWIWIHLEYGNMLWQGNGAEGECNAGLCIASFFSIYQTLALFWTCRFIVATVIIKNQLCQVYCFLFH
jgi:hypothetical protein